MKLTVGFAHSGDFHGAYFTIQALRLYFAHLMDRIELLVIENDPGTRHAEMVKGVVSQAKGQMWQARVIDMPQPKGTSAPRDRIMREAHGDAVLVMDCHVMLVPTALDKLLEFYEQNPGTLDLYHGPLLMDSLAGGPTHFNDIWGAEMWGKWGQAWTCPCGAKFTVVDKGQCEYRRLVEQDAITACECGREFPSQEFSGHEKSLVDEGHQPVGLGMDDEPFEIPGMGMGLYTCRKDAWLGYNAHARGFGGEELYIHAKYRQAGRKVWCLPFLKWVHRFGRPEGVTYPLTRIGKVRNYLLEFQEIGLDTAPLKAHFVGEGYMSEAQFDYLAADPIARDSAPAEQTVSSIDEAFERVSAIPRDLDQHMPALRDLASQVKRVTEFSERRESTIAFMAGRPESLLSFQVENDAIIDQYSRTPGFERHRTHKVEGIEETDLLFIDDEHTYDRVYWELTTFSPAVTRFIVLHDTLSHPQLVVAIRKFLEEQDAWFVSAHTDKQHGLTVLGRQERDRPEKEILLWDPGFGPGTELKELLKTLGIAEKPGCDCNAKAVQMNKWGVTGCRENRDTIVGWMQEGQKRWGWKDKVAAASKAVRSGLAFSINPADVWGSIVDECIRRAEKGPAGKACK